MSTESKRISIYENSHQISSVVTGNPISTHDVEQQLKNHLDYRKSDGYWAEIAIGRNITRISIDAEGKFTHKHFTLGE